MTMVQPIEVFADASPCPCTDVPPEIAPPEIAPPRRDATIAAKMLVVPAGRCDLGRYVGARTGARARQCFHGLCHCHDGHALRAIRLIA